MGKAFTESEGQVHAGILDANRKGLFANDSVSASRIIYTPSPFARTALLHLQEAGTLKAVQSHVSKRSGLDSYLFFTVLDGEGELGYKGTSQHLFTGNSVFVDCHYPYSHCSSSEHLWTLKWVHFYGSSMPAVYDKYIQRGGRSAFYTEHFAEYVSLVDFVYECANGNSYTRDMEINEKLWRILTLLMEDAYPSDGAGHSVSKRRSVQEVKAYIDRHFTEKITLEELGKLFYIDKYYLSKSFKEQFGYTINNYAIQLRITKAKSLLRFSEMTVRQIAGEVGIPEPNYFCRCFKKIEGISPNEYRKRW